MHANKYTVENTEDSKIMNAKLVQNLIVIMLFSVQYVKLESKLKGLMIQMLLGKLILTVEIVKAKLFKNNRKFAKQRNAILNSHLLISINAKIA